MHCYMALIDASPNTLDCRLGKLCGCGARFCGIKCLVAATQAHRFFCENIQSAFQTFAEGRFRATEKTNRPALKWGGHVQINLFRADLLVAASDAINALLYVADDLHKAEAYELSQKFAQRALSLSATGSLDEARAFETLGNVALTLSKYDAAAAHYEASLKIRKTVLGDNHADVARVNGNFSMVLQELGRTDEALAMISSTLEFYSKAPGDNEDSIALCHQNMGNNLKRQGKLQEAMGHYSIGLEMASRTKGTAKAADLLDNIGTVLESQNKLDEAMEKYLSALKIHEKEKSDTGIATCHQNIGTVLMQQGKLDAALEHVRKSLEIKRSKLSYEHADCASSHVLIGNILFCSGKFADALDEYTNALRIRKNVYGEMTLKVADVYQSKAMCYFELRDWREAVTFYEATIHIRTVLGAHDALLDNLKARLAEAEEMLQAERSSAAASEQRK
jgi:tetratricopeptide (TPR) repeat protein